MAARKVAGGDFGGTTTQIPRAVMRAGGLSAGRAQRRAPPAPPTQPARLLKGPREGTSAGEAPIEPAAAGSSPASASGGGGGALAAEPLDACGPQPLMGRTWLARGRRRGEALAAGRVPAAVACRLSVGEVVRVAVNMLVYQELCLV